jgi:mono/diheme cytochrome c family protein
MTLTIPAENRVRFERALPTESADIQAIVRGILAVQARFAETDHTRLERGTNAKGVCARAMFEVFDVRALISDPKLASRLARGIFAHPGTYPAMVRFANGASRIQRDRAADVRALSFSIDVPLGLVGATTRLDFSMNSATTFPINDAHAFATVLRVLGAGSKWAIAKAFWSLPFRDMVSFLQSAVRGALQEHRKLCPYQTDRYWSCVPYRHGPDEAIKYSATPLETNPSQPLSAGANCLRDELVRHLKNDTPMSAWNFGLQLLDVDRMTHRGRRREAPYWIENGSIEWNESQAPFHTVARLTLVHDSELTDEAAGAMYIDVTQYAAPNCEPLGSLNRARWAAETASRQSRMSGVSEVPPEVPLRRSRTSRVFRWAVVALVLLLAGRISVGWWYSRNAAAYLPPSEQISDVRYLDQGWGTTIEAPARQLYYYTPQGASMHGIRYSWFINLEMPFSRTRFADPGHMRRLRFIVDPYPTRSNPDLLPVGFTRRYDETVQDYVADITCAACHTGQLNVKRPDGRLTAVRIDGGQAMHAVSDAIPGSFQFDLLAAFGTTLFNPIKFNRFADNVLGANASLSTKNTLWNEMFGVFRTLVRVSRGSGDRHWYPTQEGFGRTDALARIANTVFGDHLDPVNYRTGNAPVSFPYLWNIWKFDWVQYNASVSQPLARNVGEVMGTGATYRLVDDYGRPVPPSERYRTSVAWDNLEWIETTLQSLQPPPWPEDLLGRVDMEKANRGRTLFNEYCVGCHGPHMASDAVARSVSPLRGPGDPLWQIRWKALDDIGTDPNAATNFVRNRVDITRSGLEASEVGAMLKRELERKQALTNQLVTTLRQQVAARTAAHAPQAEIASLQEQLHDAVNGYGNTNQAFASLSQIDLRSVSIGEGLTIFGSIIRAKYYEDRHLSKEAQACIEGFGTPDLPQSVPGYKPRPLKGVWATPPYLHNGSVPTIYALLSPAKERPARFYVGTREYDRMNMGYVTAPPSSTSGGFWYDTSLSGNHNIGHEFRKGYVKFDDSKPPETQYQNGVIGPELTPEQRYAIIEYLKIGPDEPQAAAPHVPPDCSALIAGRPAAPASPTTLAAGF